MDPEEALERLGGVADVRALLALTTRARLRRSVGRGTVVRDARGRYALDGVDASVRAAHALSGVLVELSAARFHGWEVKRPPESAVVAVPRNRKVAAVRRRGVAVRYLDLDDDQVSGRATTPVATVMWCAARLPFDEALAVADSALRHEDVTRAGLREAAREMPLRYRARCLRVAAEATSLADNPFESVLRAIALDVPGLHVEAQVWIEPVGRPDLADRVRGLVVEADSFEFHGRRIALTADCERYNAFVLAGWTVVRFAWEHVMFHPDYVRDVLRGLVKGPGGRALDLPQRRRTA